MKNNNFNIKKISLVLYCAMCSLAANAQTGAPVKTDTAAQCPPVDYRFALKATASVFGEYRLEFERPISATQSYGGGIGVISYLRTYANLNQATQAHGVVARFNRREYFKPVKKFKLYAEGEISYAYIENKYVFNYTNQNALHSQYYSGSIYGTGTQFLAGHSAALQLGLGGRWDIGRFLLDANLMTGISGEIGTSNASYSADATGLPNYHTTTGYMNAYEMGTKYTATTFQHFGIPVSLNVLLGYRF
jgi:hypothetical protein